MARPPLSDQVRSNAAASNWWRALRRTEARLQLMGLGAMVAVWAFLALTGEVRELETAPFDRAVFRLPGDLATPIGPRWLQESGRDVTALGGFMALTLIIVRSIVLLLMHGRRLQTLVFGGTVVAAQVAAATVKHVVDRARPDLVSHQDLVYSSSFPSGHAVMAPVVYLTLAAILAAGDAPRSVKVLLLVSAGLPVVAIGVSRVYLGVHWPTDVLAGWTMGTAIALASSIALHVTAPKR